jgi:hypothetical protein
VLSANVSGCEGGGPEFDANLSPAQPSCVQGVTCAAPEASTSSDASAPPLDAGVMTFDASAPPLDANAVVDAVVVAIDALAPESSDAALDAAAPASDAESDAARAGDAAAFPMISDPAAKGPYTSKTLSNAGPGGAYTVFHPSELASSGVLHPIVTWGNGGFTSPTDYPQLPHLASHGFVVIAANDSLVTGPQVRMGLDWIVQQNEQASSPFYKKLDLKRIAGVGYSNGGLATLDVADDARYVTIVIISGANLNEDSRSQNMPKLHTPIAYLCTDDDASEGNCSADFAVVKMPAFFGVMKGTAHTDVTTILGLGVASTITRVGSATTAWLRWQVLGDPSFKPSFVGADCGLCKDTNWAAQQKGLQ